MNAPTALPTRNFQGLRHPRHRRQDTHTRNRRAYRPGNRQRSTCAQADARRRRARRPALRAGSCRGAGARPGQQRLRCHRHRHGADAGGLLRDPSPRHPHRRRGHRQPQSARLQRAQDGHRRRDTLRRSHPETAPSGCSTTTSSPATARSRRPTCVTPTSTASPAM